MFPNKQILDDTKLVFYDIESYPNYTLVVFYHAFTGEYKYFEYLAEDSGARRPENNLGDILSETRPGGLLAGTYLFGYNSSHYDDYVLQYILNSYRVSGICLPAGVKSVSDDIVSGKIKPWQVLQSRFPNTRLYDEEHRKPFIGIDLCRILGFSQKAKEEKGESGESSGSKSLKELGLILDDSQGVFTTPIPFTENVKEEDIPQIKEYCKRDVDLTYKLYLDDNIQEALEVRKVLAEETNHKLEDLISAKGSRIGHFVLASLGKEKDASKLVPFKGAEIFKKCSWLDPDKMPDDVQEHFIKPIMNHTFSSKERKNDSDEDDEDDEGSEKIFKSYKGKAAIINVAGVPVQLGFGGIHSKDPARLIVPKPDELLLDLDVTSFYPNLIIKQDLRVRGLDINISEFLIQTLDRRVQEKAKAKDSSLSEEERHAAKIKSELGKLIMNSVYGDTRAAGSILYDPLVTYSVTVIGQLTMIQLMLEVSKVSQVLSANTDGILVLVKKENLENLRQLYQAWSEKTGFQLEETLYKGYLQTSVNKYIAIECSGKVKTKGDGFHIENDVKVQHKQLVTGKLMKASLEAAIKLQESGISLSFENTKQLFEEQVGLLMRTFYEGHPGGLTEKDFQFWVRGKSLGFTTEEDAVNIISEKQNAKANNPHPQLVELEKIKAFWRRNPQKYKTLLPEAKALIPSITEFNKTLVPRCEAGLFQHGQKTQPEAGTVFVWESPGTKKHPKTKLKEPKPGMWKKPNQTEALPNITVPIERTKCKPWPNPLIHKARVIWWSAIINTFAIDQLPFDKTELVGLNLKKNFKISNSDELDVERKEGNAYEFWYDGGGWDYNFSAPSVGLILSDYYLCIDVDNPEHAALLGLDKFKDLTCCVTSTEATGRYKLIFFSPQMTWPSGQTKAIKRLRKNKIELKSGRRYRIMDDKVKNSVLVRGSTSAVQILGLKDYYGNYHKINGLPPAPIPGELLKDLGIKLEPVNCPYPEAVIQNSLKWGFITPEEAAKIPRKKETDTPKAKKKSRNKEPRNNSPTLFDSLDEEIDYESLDLSEKTKWVLKILINEGQNLFDDRYDSIKLMMSLATEKVPWELVRRILEQSANFDEATEEKTYEDFLEDGYVHEVDIKWACGVIRNHLGKEFGVEEGKTRFFETPTIDQEIKEYSELPETGGLVVAPCGDGKSYSIMKRLVELALQGNRIFVFTDSLNNAATLKRYAVTGELCLPEQEVFILSGRANEDDTTSNLKDVKALMIITPHTYLGYKGHRGQHFKEIEKEIEGSIVFVDEADRFFNNIVSINLPLASRLSVENGVTASPLSKCPMSRNKNAVEDCSFCRLITTRDAINKQTHVAPFLPKVHVGDIKGHEAPEWMTNLATKMIPITKTLGILQDINWNDLLKLSQIEKFIELLQDELLGAHIKMVLPKPITGVTPKSPCGIPILSGLSSWPFSLLKKAKLVFGATATPTNELITHWRESLGEVYKKVYTGKKNFRTQVLLSNTPIVHKRLRAMVDILVNQMNQKVLVIESKQKEADSFSIALSRGKYKTSHLYSKRVGDDVSFAFRPEIADQEDKLFEEARNCVVTYRNSSITRGANLGRLDVLIINAEAMLPQIAVKIPKTVDLGNEGMRRLIREYLEAERRILLQQAIGRIFRPGGSSEKLVILFNIENQEIEKLFPESTDVIVQDQWYPQSLRGDKFLAVVKETFDEWLEGKPVSNKIQQEISNLANAKSSKLSKKQRELSRGEKDTAKAAKKEAKKTALLKEAAITLIAYRDFSRKNNLARYFTTDEIAFIKKLFSHKLEIMKAVAEAQQNVSDDDAASIREELKALIDDYNEEYRELLKKFFDQIWPKQ